MISVRNSVADIFKIEMGLSMIPINDSHVSIGRYLGEYIIRGMRVDLACYRGQVQSLVASSFSSRVVRSHHAWGLSFPLAIDLGLRQDSM